MTRGTTPTLEFTLPFDTDTIDALNIAFSQKTKAYCDARLVLEKALEDCTVSGKTISLTLSQEDTLLLDASQDVEIQLRVLSGESALASQIIKVPVGRILRDGVLSVGGGAG